MIRPITIERAGRGYTVRVDHAKLTGAIVRGEGGKLAIGEGEPAVLSSGDAAGYAFQIGKYRLGLGNFASTYTTAPDGFRGWR